MIINKIKVSELLKTLDKIIETRKDSSLLGFGGNVKSKSQIKDDEVLSKVEPHDLIKFGLIPEFVGRVPVTVALDALTKEDMVHILTEPKNSIVKQYKKLFELDGVQLSFSKDALEAIAEKAMEKLGALRGCEVHSSVILSQVDEKIFKRLGINLTCQARFKG